MGKEEKVLDLNKLIDNYYNKFKNLLYKERITEGVESIKYISTTEIVPPNYFDKNVYYCDLDKEIFYKEFENIYVIFNDIENSTKILKYCEESQNLCIYIGYIKYSSELLSEIINYFKGKIIEITGDGNYSIIEELNPTLLLKLIEYNNLKKELKILDTIFDKICFITGDSYYFKNIIRNLFLYIFNEFNYKINDLLQKNKINIRFNMRFGCEYGNCKITNFKIGNYLKQDKLIGTIIHKAAHQAQNK
jgi:hypothetical protein